MALFSRKLPEKILFLSGALFGRVFCERVFSLAFVSGWCSMVLSSPIFGREPMGVVTGLGFPPLALLSLLCLSLSLSSLFLSLFLSWGASRGSPFVLLFLPLSQRGAVVVSCPQLAWRCPPSCPLSSSLCSPLPPRRGRSPLLVLSLSFVSFSLSLSFYRFLFLWLSSSIPVCLSVCMLVVFVCLSIGLSVSQSVCLSVFLTVCLLAWLFVCL